MSVAIITMLVCCSIIVAAAISDWRSFRIPNVYPVLLILIFVLSKLYLGFSNALWSHVGHFLITFLVGMLLFRFGLFGGGDAKLYAAIALWFPLAAGPILIAEIGLSGGVLAIGYLLSRMLRRRRLVSSRQPSNEVRERRIPYGVAIAAGALATIATVGWHNVFVSPPAFDLTLLQKPL